MCAREHTERRTPLICKHMMKTRGSQEHIVNFDRFWQNSSSIAFYSVTQFTVRCSLLPGNPVCRYIHITDGVELQ